MANLDWRKHDKDISSFVKRITNYYLRTEASTGELLRDDQGILVRNNYATPSKIKALLGYLKEVTLMVGQKISQIRQACVAASIPLDECVAGSTTYGPIYKDYQDWTARFETYEKQTNAAIARNPDASGNEDPVFWESVTLPLLLGLYPGQEKQSKLDAVTPLTMAWQIEIAEDSYKEARQRFWKDLKQSAKDVVEGIGTFGGAGILLGLAALAFGYGYARGK